MGCAIQPGDPIVDCTSGKVGAGFRVEVYMYGWMYIHI